MELFSIIKRYLTQRFYVVGIGRINHSRFNSTSRAGMHIKWLRYANFKQDWIADPFIFEVKEDRMTVFAEQMESATGKGKLVKIDLSLPKMRILRMDTILELDTHLSFPNFIKVSGNTYVYPENYQSGRFKIYEYNYETGRLENPIVLINEPLLDAQILEVGGVFYILSVKYSTGKLEDTRHLYIWKSTSLMGPYSLFQEIISEDNTERGAGQIISHNGEYYRPVQDCNGDYGRKVIFKKLSLENGKFKETAVGQYWPSAEYPEGLHTYNLSSEYEIVDGLAYSCGNILTYINRIRR